MTHGDPTTYIYKSTPGCAIHADVCRAGSSAQPAPVLVYLHGGALIYGSRRNLHPRQRELYLGQGWTVVQVDYRLAPETKLPAIVEDVSDAFRWIAERGPELFGADLGRIGAVGHSAGGYLALSAGYIASVRPKAIVSFYGYGDIVGDWYTQPDPFYCAMPAVSLEESGWYRDGGAISEPYEGRGLDKYYLYLRQHGLWPQAVSGHDPAQELPFFRAYCPVHNLTPAYPPTLLLHGDRDTDVPYEQSTLMAQALAQAGVEHRLITISGGGHGFDREMEAPAVREAFGSVLAFLQKHLAARV
jgi:acetyl esterase/lipase